MGKSRPGIKKEGFLVIKLKDGVSAHEAMRAWIDYSGESTSFLMEHRPNYSRSSLALLYFSEEEYIDVTYRDSISIPPRMAYIRLCSMNVCYHRLEMLYSFLNDYSNLFEEIEALEDLLRLSLHKEIIITRLYCQDCVTLANTIGVSLPLRSDKDGVPLVAKVNSIIDKIGDTWGKDYFVPFKMMDD